MTIELEYLKRIQLQAGDTLILKSTKPLTIHQAQHLKQILADQFPYNKAIVLDPSMDLEIVSDP